LGWLKFECKFSSKWLSFEYHSTPSSNVSAVPMKNQSNPTFINQTEKKLDPFIQSKTVKDLTN
jgi:hypothetical protein